MKRTLVCLMVLGAFLALIVAPVGAQTLKLLTWKGYAPKKLVDKFEKETGIKVELTYSNNEEMIAKLRATRGAGFDLAQPSQDRISSVQAAVQDLPAHRLLADRARSSSFPRCSRRVKKNTLVKGKSYAVPFCWGTSGLIVNKAKAPGADDWNALLDPQYKGRVSYRLKRPTLIAMGFAWARIPLPSTAILQPTTGCSGQVAEP